MKTNKKYTFEELLNISTEEFDDWKGLTLNVLKKDGTEFTGLLSKMLLALNPPHRECGLIFDGDIQVLFTSINTLSAK